MLAAWLTLIRSGLSRHRAADRICGTQGASPGRTCWRRLYPYFRRHRSHAIAGAAAIGLSTLVGFAPPMITRYLVDEVILGRRLELVAAAVAILALCLAAEKALRLAEEFCFARFEQRALLDIQQGLITRTLRLPKAFFDDQQTGYLTRRLTEDVESLRFLFSGTLANAAGQGLRLVGGAGLLLYLEWRLAVLMLAMLPAIGWALRYFAGRVYLLSRERLEQQAEAAGRIQESLAGAAVNRIVAGGSGSRGRIMASLRRVFRATLEQSVVSSLTAACVQSVPGAGRALALAAGAVLVIRGEWTLGSLLAFQAYLTHVFGPAQFLSAADLELERARAALDRVAALFDMATEDEDARGSLRVGKLTGEIEFRNVTFGYPGAAPVLRDVCLHVRPGEAVALMGPSGVGKTSLVSLLLRFYKPTAGEIYFDGRPAAEFELDALRRRMGYVPQRPQLTSGTILDNIRCGDPQAPIAMVLSSAGLAGIHEDVLSMPQGYLTQVGEGGLKLSEGQKQRLALARALVTDPDILILDEPTASLDAPTEHSVLEALSAWRKGRTLFVATHRLSTAGRCDRVLFLDGDGTVGSENLAAISRHVDRAHAPGRLATGAGSLTKHDLS